MRTGMTIKSSEELSKNLSPMAEQNDEELFSKRRLKKVTHPPSGEGGEEEEGGTQIIRVTPPKKCVGIMQGAFTVPSEPHASFYTLQPLNNLGGEGGVP